MGAQGQQPYVMLGYSSHVLRITWRLESSISRHAPQPVMRFTGSRSGLDGPATSVFDAKYSHFLAVVTATAIAIDLDEVERQ